MKNRLITNTGNSNLIKMALNSSMSWEQFRAAAIAGTLPADIVATTDGTGTSQVGTPLTEANLLTSETATALGVSSSDPTINEAFESLEVTQSVIDALAAIGITTSGPIAQTLLDVAEALGVSYVVESGGNNYWKWKKYSDGTFQAWRFSSEGSTGSLTQIGSSGIYNSSPAQVTFPTDLIGITSITSCVVECAPSANYFLLMGYNRLTTTGCYAYYLRLGSNTSVSGIHWGVTLSGTWA